MAELGSAARYLRVSTERQDYSLAYQSKAIDAYARGHGYQVVCTYVDDGVSGLGIEGRNGLKALLADVLTGLAQYQVVLVYDISRWGRFQNPDQAAHYEFLCSEAGVRVEYCAEDFPNDSSISTSLLKALRRVMAAEYSRELSRKIRSGRELAGADGFWLGGRACYAYRRQLVKRTGQRGQIMDLGDRKALGSGWRVQLVSGPAEEIAVVKEIYRRYAVRRQSVNEISRALNERGILAEGGTTWSKDKVRHVLNDERYVGNRTIGKFTCELGRAPRPNDRTSWRTLRGVYPAIVSPSLFKAVQAERARRSRNGWTDAELLDGLRRLHERHGMISERLIRDDPSLPSNFTFRRRLGGLIAVHERLGFAPPARAVSMSDRSLAIAAKRRAGLLPTSNEDYLELARRILLREGRLDQGLIDRDPSCPAASAYRHRFGSLGALYALLGYKPCGAVQEAAVNRCIRRGAKRAAQRNA